MRAETLGYSLFCWRHLVCVGLIAILPLSLAAQEAAGGMLRSDGVGILVNKNPVPASIALFQNDLVETGKAAIARIDIHGSSADLNPGSMVQFDTGELALDHGSIAVNTNRGLRVRVGCITVTPVHDGEWTHYEVADVDGKVTVSARKSDVYIDAHSKNFQDVKHPDRSDRSIVRETEQRTRDENCAAGNYRRAGVLANPGPILNNPWVVGSGAAAAGAITCIALCRNDDPISPAKPGN